VLFSIIIPTFNRLALLQGAVQSAQRQTFTDFELIIVDDGSVDGSYEWAASLDGVRAFRQANAGAAAARNLGGRHAGGHYLVFLDSDDLLFPDALATYARVIERAAPALIIGARIETVGFAVAERAEADLRTRSYDDYFAAAASGANFQTSCGVVKREEFERAGGFDATLTCGEDQDFALRLGEARGCQVIEAPAQTIYRRHPDSLTGDLSALIRGADIVVARERAGGYPGGRVRQAQRRSAIVRLVIPVSVAAARLEAAEGWRLFRSIAGWAASAHRWKYVFGFPLLRMRFAATHRG
jgi:glycosyltransferase involved in cell wall biosynthesis